MASAIRCGVRMIRVAYIAEALRGIGRCVQPKGNALEGSEGTLQRAESYKISKLGKPESREQVQYI